MNRQSILYWQTLLEVGLASTGIGILCKCGTQALFPGTCDMTAVLPSFLAAFEAFPGVLPILRYNSWWLVSFSLLLSFVSVFLDYLIHAKYITYLIIYDALSLKKKKNTLLV